MFSSSSRYLCSQRHAVAELLVLLRQQTPATVREKALARDPKDRTVWGLARQHFISMRESFWIICLLWFCKGWCRSNKVSNTVSKANIPCLHSDLTSIVPEVHEPYLTFLRRLDELRGHSSGLWNLSHLQPSLLSSSLGWGSSLLYKYLKGCFTQTLRKTVVHLFLPNILQGSDAATPTLIRVLHHGGGRKKRVK